MYQLQVVNFKQKGGHAVGIQIFIYSKEASVAAGTLDSFSTITARTPSL